MSKFSIQTIVALFITAIVPATLFTVGFGFLTNSFSNQSNNYLASSNPIMRVFGETLVWSYLCLCFPFPVALVHLAALGIPAFLLGWRIRRIDWKSVLIISFLIGAIPWGLLIGLTSSSVSSNPWQAVKEASIVGAAMGLLGVSGGMTFWFLWRFWITPLNPDISAPLLDKDS